MNLLPIAFLESISSQFGNDFSEDLKNCITDADSPTSIRFQKQYAHLKINELLNIETKVAWDKNAYYLTERPLFAHDPLWHSGVYYVQEASSMILAYILKQHISDFSNLKVLDLCAAPGGKSTQVLSLLNESSFMVCNEILPKRAQVLKENIIKSGFENVAITTNDSKDFLCFQNTFDLVLVDAPCSGEGLFRKDHDAIAEWSLDNIQNCVYRQKEILNNAIQLVKDHGYLVYSTCTYNYEENIQQIQYLIDTGLFESINLEIPKEFGFTTIHLKEAFGIQAFPNKVKGEGFFISILRKKNSITKDTFSKDFYFDSVFKKLDDKFIALIESFYQNKQEAFYIKEGDIYSWNKMHIPFIKQLYNNLKCIYCSKKVGELKKEIFIPSNDLIFLHQILKDCGNKKLDLDKPNAIKFLKKENIDKEFIPQINQSEWYIVSYLNFPLGWLKVMNQQKQNNYYPLEWRLRK